MRKVNWYKTLYFNFKKFPFATARKLPVYFYGPVKFQDISGKISIETNNITRGMIGFGQPYEKTSIHKGIAELVLIGSAVFKGKMQFGKDYFFYIAKNAHAEFGHMSSMGTNAKFVCTDKVVLGNYCRIGFESQIIDTNFHQMIDTLTGERFKINGPIKLGDFNYFSNRISIMHNTVTPDYCTIASNTLCNRDYTSFGNNILIGGIPAKKLKNNITRDWEAEIPLLDEWMRVF